MELHATGVGDAPSPYRVTRPSSRRLRGLYELRFKTEVERASVSTKRDCSFEALVVGHVEPVTLGGYVGADAGARLV